MAEISSIPPGMTYVQFIGVGEAAKRFNIDDIGLYFGEPVFGVSLNKSNGFEVQEGQSDSIVATAGNGTAPYTYGWDSTLGATLYRIRRHVHDPGDGADGQLFSRGDGDGLVRTGAGGSAHGDVFGGQPAPGQPAVVISGSLSARWG